MRDYYARQQTAAGFLHEVGRKGHILWAFYLGPALTVPYPAAFRELGTRFLQMPLGRVHQVRLQTRIAA